MWQLVLQLIGLLEYVTYCIVLMMSPAKLSGFTCRGPSDQHQGSKSS